MAAGCAIDLDDPEAPATASDAIPTLATCLPLGARAGGRVQSFELPDGAVIVTAGELRDGDQVVSQAVVVSARDTLGDCLDVATMPLRGGLDTSPLDGAPPGEIQGIFSDGETVFAYVRTFSGFDAIGTALATFDSERAAFVSEAEYLFNGDFPAYGEAVLRDGDFVFLYGCSSTSAFHTDCYVARAPLADVRDRSAYRFYRGSADYAGAIDDAWPIFEGGSGLAVAASAGEVRAYYVRPLGDTISMRRGLAPSGPWSSESTVTRCEPEGFLCGGVSVHAVLETDGETALTYAPFSFDPVPPESLRTRLLRVLDE